MRVMAIIGAGEVGSQIARAAIANGYEVVIANSRGPETLKDLIEELGPSARAMTAADAAEAGDFAAIAVRLKPTSQGHVASSPSRARPGGHDAATSSDTGEPCIPYTGFASHSARRIETM